MKMFAVYIDTTVYLFATFSKISGYILQFLFMLYNQTTLPKRLKPDTFKKLEIPFSNV